MSHTTDYLDDLRDCQAREAALTEERDRLKVMGEDYDLALGKSQARLAALTAALKKYGEHLPTCVIFDKTQCRCGLQAALDAAGGAP